jgi:ribosomal protein S18 acetylase RimI-like enzyme
MEPTLISPSLLSRATATLTLAFAADPMVRWSWQAPELFLASFPRFVHAIAGNAFSHDGAYAIDDLRGVALWLPPGVESDDALLEALFEETVPKRQTADGAKMFELMAAHHPKEPHWYLPVIGIDPRAQGRKLGEALMQPALARCDRDGLPAYLESSNPRNIPFYERLGFRVLTKLQVGESPELVPMLRPPRTSV